MKLGVGGWISGVAGKVASAFLLFRLFVYQCLRSVRDWASDAYRLSHQKQYLVASMGT